MKQVRISDRTMAQVHEDLCLSFKERIELARLLDKLGVDVIELPAIQNSRIDSLGIKSIAATVENATIAVPVELGNEESVKETFQALSTAKAPRLQVVAATSPVQIEYLFHKKPDAMIEAIASTVAACRALCLDVEFIAEDATRSEEEFLDRALAAAISAGATTVTVSDTAGSMLPAELAAFIRRLSERLPALSSVTLGVASSNALAMADASAIAAVAEGASEIHAAAYPLDCASLRNVARILAAKSDELLAETAIRTTELDRMIEKVVRTCKGRGDGAEALGATAEEDIFLTAHDDPSAVAAAARRLGYDLSEEDERAVYAAFSAIAAKKERVGLKELDAIVASSAMQVPATYTLDTYVITSGNTISATAHIKLLKNGTPAEGVYIGDGSIDAAFQAIEKITGCHYELDDFQLQAVTEGREAMGETVVKLRAGGRVYSGRGISTDIVGAGIKAYLSALNKIVYEEEIE